MKFLTRNIWILSIISLLNDVSSEMLYPVMPLFLSSIGFSVAGLGFIEGLAEAIAGISKSYFGMWSDAAGKRLPFIRIGYFLSALSKLVLGFAKGFPLVFVSRTSDRFGKGIRTAARDALLSDEANTQTKSRVFGFHRSMDTLGATIGPIVALLFLYWIPGEYTVLFKLAFIPAMAGVLLTYYIKEKNRPSSSVKLSWSFGWGFVLRSGRKFKTITALLVAFALINSSDVFLLLRLKELTHSDTTTISMYILYNFVYALSAFPAGVLAHKIGLRNTIAIGFSLFGLVYLSFGLSQSTFMLGAALVVYGLYAAATEGISKALITNIVPPSQVATALGVFGTLSAVSSLLASVWAGFVWQYAGAELMFLISGAGALLISFLLYIVTRYEISLKTNN